MSEKYTQRVNIGGSMENVILIGMSGAGKSTLGVLLAKALNLDFLDTDLVIQRKYNKKLEQIIEDQGIDTFKRYEENVICSIHIDNTVIATGGSVIYSDKSMNHLKTLGKIVFIDVEYNALAERIIDIKTRGIVIEPNQTFKDLFDQRYPLYKKYADIVLSVDEGAIETTMNQLLTILVSTF